MYRMLLAASAAFCVLGVGCSDDDTTTVTYNICVNGLDITASDCSNITMASGGSGGAGGSAPNASGHDGGAPVSTNPAACVEAFTPCQGTDDAGQKSAGRCDKFGGCCVVCLQGNGICAPLPVKTCGEHGEACYPCP